MPETPITTIGEVLEIVSERLCRLRLKNGKELLGFLGKAAVSNGMKVEVGDRASVEMTPYDFSKARIVKVRDGDECRGE